MKLINLADYEKAARSKIPESFFGYYAGGAGDEITLRENVTGWGRVKLRPRMLVDVSERDTSVTILGKNTSMPIVIAPTAMARLAHPDGEPAVARAAKDAGIIQCVSTFSNAPLEEVAAEGAANWFQLYVYRDRRITERVVQRAVEAGYRAIVLTVDVPVLAIRENILRTGLQLPRGMTFGNFDDVHDTDAATVNAYFEEQIDPSLTWKDLEWLASVAPVPVLVKGILRADDATKAIECGATGIIVSNHGGRQLDTAVTGLDALGEVVAAVGSEVEVFVDGGVRRGTDVVKALAMGARAVLVGRPVLWGLATGGQEGVAKVLEILAHELDTAMALCGCASAAHIGPDLIAR